MPFFLVTHTALVEADSAEVAAHDVVETFRSGVAVSVKSDEVTSRTVILPAKRAARDLEGASAETTAEVTSPVVALGPDRPTADNDVGAVRNRSAVFSAFWQGVGLGIIAMVTIWFLMWSLGGCAFTR